DRPDEGYPSAVLQEWAAYLLAGGVLAVGEDAAAQVEHGRRLLLLAAESQASPDAAVLQSALALLRSDAEVAAAGTALSPAGFMRRLAALEAGLDVVSSGLADEVQFGERIDHLASLAGVAAGTGQETEEVTARLSLLRSRAKLYASDVR